MLLHFKHTNVTAFANEYPIPFPTPFLMLPFYPLPQVSQSACSPSSQHPSSFLFLRQDYVPSPQTLYSSLLHLMGASFHLMFIGLPLPVGELFKGRDLYPTLPLGLMGFQTWSWWSKMLTEQNYIGYDRCGTTLWRYKFQEWKKKWDARLHTQSSLIQGINEF